MEDAGIAAIAQHLVVECAADEQIGRVSRTQHAQHRDHRKHSEALRSIHVLSVRATSFMRFTTVHDRPEVSTASGGWLIRPCVMYCSRMPNIDADPTRSDRHAHLRRDGRARSRRGVDLDAPRPRQPARPRLPWRHPHPAVLRRSVKDGVVDPISPVTVTEETPVMARLTAAAASASRWPGAGWRWPSPRPRRPGSAR